MWKVCCWRRVCLFQSHVFLCYFSCLFVSVSMACCTRVRGHAHRSAPPRGWHSERIITINEKVNGAFSFISIYIWLFGRTNDFWVVVNNATVRRNKKRRSNVFLWTSNVVKNDASAECKSDDRPRSTVPSWKLSDTMRGNKETFHSGAQSISCLQLTFQIKPFCLSSSWT